MDYDDQLERALSETPDVQAGSERFEVPEPEVRAEGHVTVYENFQATVERLDRDESEVLKFLQDELGTSAQIDESGRARLTGSFDADRIGGVVDEYVDRFVRCPECGLPDTHLEREHGALLIQCDACGARSPAGG